MRLSQEVAYRNLRNKTVMRNFVAVEEVIRARLSENLGIEQVVVINNDSTTPLGPVPANTIHVTVGEIGAHITDEDIGRVILAAKGLGCPTYGTTSVTVDDDQGNPKVVYFSKATPQPIFMDIEVLFLSEDYAGAEESIRADLLTHINGLATDEDVIWSRLFGIITPYAKAQVNKLELSEDGMTFAASNIVITPDEFANSVAGNINITVVN